MDAKPLKNKRQNELEEAIKRYAVANAEKKSVTQEVKDIGDEIKDMMDEADLASYEVEGIKATLSMRMTRTLDIKAVEKLLGRPIPADCYKLAETAVLNVKAA